jgi:uncharacterized protein Yka (UPF0111/DUF47 family)
MDGCHVKQCYRPIDFNDLFETLNDTQKNMVKRLCDRIDEVDHAANYAQHLELHRQIRDHEREADRIKTAKVWEMYSVAMKAKAMNGRTFDDFWNTVRI